MAKIPSPNSPLPLGEGQGEGLGKGSQSQPPEPNPYRLIHPEIWARLTKRQTEVLDLYLHDPNDKAIARLLKISVSTVRSHLSAIEKKARVDSRAELLALFIPDAGDKSPSSK